MSYRRRAEFGLRRSFFAADGPSCTIHVLNQNLESANVILLLRSIDQNPATCHFLLRCKLCSFFFSSRTAELYSVSPITFDTTVVDYWQRVSMCVSCCDARFNSHCNSMLMYVSEEIVHVAVASSIGRPLLYTCATHSTAFLHLSWRHSI